jgi:hypothetical protein
MHTVIILGAGAALLIACLLLGHAWAGTPGLVRGAWAFIPLWLAVAGANMWVGVSRAGYSVAQELPFFALVFGVMAGVAALIAWRAAA